MRQIGFATMVACACITSAAAHAPATTRLIPGVAPAATADLATLFFQQIVRCWNPPSVRLGTAPVIVKLEVHLDITGKVTDAQTLAPLGGGAAAEFAIMQATAAVYSCAPYKLPADRYGQWRDVVIVFDPSLTVPLTPPATPPTRR